MRAKPKNRHGLVVDSETSARLARVRQHGTEADLLVRRAASALWHRYRVANRDLPGRPDPANRKRRWAVFVHGRFWHRHPGCARPTTPKRNREFWQSKFAANTARAAHVVSELRAAGYRVLAVWECEAEKPALLVRRMSRLPLAAS